MKRKIYNDLLEWKNETVFKPLMILGVRQCGQSYIIDKFCKNEYKYYKKINLLDDKAVVDLYKSNKSAVDKFRDLKLIIEICDSINGYIHHNVEFGFSGKGGIITLKGLIEEKYSETEFNRDLKIVSVHVDYNIC